MKFLKRILHATVRWLYRVSVDELYVPKYQTFSIGYKHESRGVVWDSALPDVLALHVKDLNGKWQDAVLER